MTQTNTQEPTAQLIAQVRNLAEEANATTAAKAAIEALMPGTTGTYAETLFDLVERLGCAEEAVWAEIARLDPECRIG